MSTRPPNYPKVTCIRSSESLTSKSQVCRMLTNFLQSEKAKLEVHPRHCMYWQDLLQLTGTLATSSREKRKLADLQPADPFALIVPTSPTGAVDKEEEQLLSLSLSSSSPDPIKQEAATIKHEPDATNKQEKVNHEELAKGKEEPSAKSKEEEKEDKKAKKAARKARKEAKKAKKESKKRKHENI